MICRRGYNDKRGRKGTERSFDMKLRFRILSSACRVVNVPKKKEVTVLGKRSSARALSFVMAFVLIIMSFASPGEVSASSGQWVRQSGKWYYMEGGSPATGWLKWGKEWYYLDPSTGEMKTGWIKENGKWYYLDAKTGVMRTGIFSVEGKNYLSLSSGALVTGKWAEVAGEWYYTNASGVICTCKWQKSGGKWYYLKADGRMARSESLEIDGYLAAFDASGKMTGYTKIEVTPTNAPTSTPTVTHAPTNTPTPTTAQTVTYLEWKSDGTAYHVGDLVIYDGKVYECLRDITGQVNWEPPMLEAQGFWKYRDDLGGGVVVTPTPTKVPTNTPIPTAAPTAAGTPTPTPVPVEGRTVTGSFIQAWYVAGWTYDRWMTEFTNMKRNGMDTLILQSVMEVNYDTTFSQSQDPDLYTNVLSRTALYPSDISLFAGANYGDSLGNCLAAAKQSGMRVFLGTVADNRWWKYGWGIPQMPAGKTDVVSDSYLAKYFADNAALSNAIAGEIWDRYGDEYGDQIAGWYYYNEIWNISDACAGTDGGVYAALIAGSINASLDYYSELTPGKPFLISPFVNPTLSTPEQNGKMWEDIFALTSFREGDIFAPQDSAGNYPNIALEEWFAAYRSAVDKKQGLALWANNENFNQGMSAIDQQTFFDHVDRTAPYVDKNICFSWNHYFAPNDFIRK